MAQHCSAVTGAPIPSGNPRIALVGNPNCGKTTIYNLLTGTHQSVGNWPGVTVERRAGNARLGEGQKIEVVDLPGIYSLMGGGGEDQAVARHFLRDEDVDLIVQVVDASALERHLLLAAELVELERPLLLILNMVDEAQDRGLEIDARALAAHLGVPVIHMVARQGKGLRELRQALGTALRTPPLPARPLWEPALEASLNALGAQLGEHRRRFLAWQYLEMPETTPPLLHTVRDRIAQALQQQTTEELADLLPAARFAWAAELTSQVVHPSGKTGWRQHATHHLDRWILHDWLGVPIFLALLYLVFVVSFSGGNILLDFFDQASAALLMHGFGHLLLQIGAPDWVVSSLAGGIGGGLNLVISFIPPIGLTFLFLAFLEDSGYMARAAYVMDRMMRRVGLPGNALVPMVIGFGCNVPAIMGARIIDDPRGRVLTVLMQPFMSCSARLTIYMAFAVVFFRGNGGQVVFLLYLTGILMALFTAWLLGKTALRGEARPFVMELPPYRLPSLRSVVLQAWQRLRIFVLRVGKVIAAIGFILFLLPGIGWTSQGLRATDIDHSLLAQGSEALVPLFAPMGIERDNWPAVAGLVAGAAAKEVVIGTLNGIYQRQAGGDLMAQYRQVDLLQELRDALATIPENAGKLVSSLGDPLGLSDLGNRDASIADSGASSQTLGSLAQSFTPLSALAYLLFVLLYVPCASTMGALRREVGWGWMLFSVGYGIGMAWAVATLLYQWGTYAAHPQETWLWTAGIGVALGILLWGLRRQGRHKQNQLRFQEQG